MNLVECDDTNNLCHTTKLYLNWASNGNCIRTNQVVLRVISFSEWARIWHVVMGGTP